MIHMPLKAIYHKVATLCIRHRMKWDAVMEMQIESRHQVSTSKSEATPHNRFAEEVVRSPVP